MRGQGVVNKAVIGQGSADVTALVEWEGLVYAADDRGGIQVNSFSVRTPLCLDQYQCQIMYSTLFFQQFISICDFQVRISSKKNTKKGRENVHR